MTEREAIAQGLHYTGIAFDSWDKKTAERYKEEIAAIKKAYKVRVVKVQKKNGWFAYYGDDNFRLVQYDTAETIQKRIDGCADRIAEAKRKLDEALKEIDDDKMRLYDKLHKIQAITK